MQIKTAKLMIEFMCGCVFPYYDEINKQFYCEKTTSRSSKITSNSVTITKYICVKHNKTLKKFYINCVDCGVERVLIRRGYGVNRCKKCQKIYAETVYKENWKHGCDYSRAGENADGDMCENRNELGYITHGEIRMLEKWTTEKVKKYYDLLYLRDSWQGLDKYKIMGYCEKRLLI